MESSSDANHVIAVKYYLFTVISLLFLTVITVYSAKFIDLGRFNIILAMSIAVVKASLVLMFFMGLKWDKGFNVFIVVLSLIFFFLFIVMVFFDNHFRASLNQEEGESFGHQTPVKLNLDKVKIKSSPH